MNYIIIDGVKYKIDPSDSTKALLNDKGEKVIFEEDDNKNVDLSKISLDELKKVNPDVAKLITTAGDLEARMKKIEQEAEENDRKKKEEGGKWQELAEGETAKRKDAEDKARKSEEILGKYKETVNGILDTTLKSIPQDKQALIPQDYSSRKKLEYINNNAKLLGVTIGGGKGSEIPKNEDGVNLDEESKVQKEYDELLKKENRTSIENKQMLELSRKIKEIRLANADKKS